jgi:hypothetical protein
MRMMADVKPPGEYMPQDRNSGAAADRWGRECKGGREPFHGTDLFKLDTVLVGYAGNRNVDNARLADGYCKEFELL